MKILIIEDEELLANTIKALLEHKGFEVECVYDGNTTLDLTTCTLICRSKSVRLSDREFDVMRLLLQSGEENIAKAVRCRCGP